MPLGTNHQTVTTHANFIPELWSKKAQIAREKNLVAANLVLKNLTDEIRQKGDTIHVPKVSNMDATAKSAETAVTFAVTTEGVVNVSIDKHYEVSFLIENRLSAQTAYNQAEMYRKKQIYGLSKQIDTDVLGLRTNLTQSVGTDGQPPTDANVLRAIQYLDDADAPYEDRFFIMSPAVKNSLLQIDRYVSSDFTGMDLPVKTGMFGHRYGIPFYVTTNLPANTTGKYNLLAHKEVYTCVMQKDIILDSDKIIEHLSTAYVAEVLYGVASYRADHGVDVLGNA